MSSANKRENQLVELCKSLMYSKNRIGPRDEPCATPFVMSFTEVESSRTSLASRTHFEVLGLGFEGQVLGLGLEASNPRKLACPRLEDSTIF